ncbi:CHAD domain-containing protein, partial [Streptomyces sp. NPDC057638]|uniref:CHAD domain-containing protein n=1 Tax=Streptomyces sp. NPDC057638 TaxID=3346190 RepID=UPI0036B40979
AAATAAVRSLRTAARRIGGTLHTFRPLLDPEWADGLRSELTWLSTTLAQEHACTARLNRLLDALSRLSGNAPVPVPAARGASAARPAAAGRTGEGRPLDIGAARAAALLERQLTLARSRAHSASLQALGSARFHAVADAVAVLASELPLAKPGHRTTTAPVFPGYVWDGDTSPAAETDTEAQARERARAEAWRRPAVAAQRRLLTAVATLPLARAGHPYNAEALVNGLADASAEELQDAPWHQVRQLLRLHRYALEVRGTEADPELARAGLLLDRHRDAAEAAAAAASAARTPRIAPATAYALGVLHADQRHEVEAARFSFQEIWEIWRQTCPTRTAP